MIIRAALVVAAAMFAAAPWIINNAPYEATMGLVYKIFFFHMPSAWIFLLAAIVSGVYSAIYLFSGIVLINFFNEALGNASRSIVNNGGLIKKIYLPRELFPVASVWVSAVHFFPQLVILVGACLYAGWHPSFLQLAADSRSSACWRQASACSSAQSTSTSGTRRTSSTCCSWWRPGLRP